MPAPARSFRLDETAAVTRGRPTGIRALDKALGGGIPPGVPVLIFGPSYSGKSTLAIQIACRLPGPAYFCVPEMSPPILRTIADRSGADIAGVLVHDGPLSAWPEEATRAGARVALVDSVNKFPDPRAALEQAVTWARGGERWALCIAHETRRAKPLFRAEYEPDAVFRVTRGKDDRQTLDVWKARWSGFRGKIRLDFARVSANRVG